MLRNGIQKAIHLFVIKLVFILPYVLFSSCAHTHVTTYVPLESSTVIYSLSLPMFNLFMKGRICTHFIILFKKLLINMEAAAFHCVLLH